MRKKLMEILACPICKHEELELTIFKEKDEIEAGIIFCPSCTRFYPIKNAIPHMLPDHLRKEKEDIEFLKKWESNLPNAIKSGPIKPFSLKE